MKKGHIVLRNNYWVRLSNADSNAPLSLALEPCLRKKDEP